MRHFTLRPVYIYISQSSTKYFVAQQHCVGNTLLHFHGSRHQFYVVDSISKMQIKHIEFCGKTQHFVLFMMMCSSSLQKEHILAY
jgi:hypothetical protein